jgi:hypothetical protein
MSSRRDFLRFLIGTAACAMTPIGTTKPQRCLPGRHVERAFVNDRCAECASAEEMNYFLFTMSGARFSDRI